MLAALEAPNWSNGEMVRSFEAAFAEFLGCRHVVMTVNATMALELALLAYDFGPGDEVIVPALTFPSVVLAVLACGAVPVVCDVDPETYCISASTIAPAITGRTRAVIPTHLYCTLCDMPPILRLAQQHGIIVIEDCAHTPGAIRNRQCAGTWGHAAIFSFNQKKPLSCGEGGCLITGDDHLRDRVTWLRSFDGQACEPPRRMQRMGKVSDFQAAVLLGQLQGLSARLSETDKREEELRLKLAHLPPANILPRLPDTDRQTVYNCCLRINALRDAAAFRGALSAELGFEVTGTYMPLDLAPALDGSNEVQFRSNRLRTGGAPCAVAHRAYYSEGIRFPGYYLTADGSAVDDIASAISKVLEHF